MKRLHASARSMIFLMMVFAASAAFGQGGYDLLQTGSGASIDLSSLGLGVVPLQGVPIQSSTGTTDTIVHRTQNIPSGGGTVSANVTAVFMKSTSPVTYSGQSADVYVTINNSGGTISTSTLPQPDSLSASTGSLTFRTDGTFDSSLTINADVIFVKAGTSVTNSANYIGHQAASAITLTSTNSSWSTTAPTGYPSSSTFPSGGVYPSPVHTGRHPVIPSKCGSTVGATQPTGSAATLNNQGGKQAGPSGAALAVACVSSTTVQ